MRVAILGAGPAGLTAAFQLARSGAEVEVFEPGPAVGGAAHSLELWGERVDLGPQPFVSADPQVERFWQEIAERDFQWIERAPGAFYNGRLTRDPPSPADVLRGADMREALRWFVPARRRARGPAAADGSARAWLEERFGPRRCADYYRPFCEKLAGADCGQVEADFAAAHFDTPLARFAYPVGGAGMIYDRLADYVRGLGGRVHVNAHVERLAIDADRVCGVELAAGRTERFDRVVSTWPWPRLVEALGQAPPRVRRAAEGLHLRKSVIVYLQVAGDVPGIDLWVDVYAPELLVGRITNFSSWPGTLGRQSPQTILALEYWCSAGDPLWRQDNRELIHRAAAELITTGLLGRARLAEARVARLRDAFVVPRQGEHRAAIADYLGQFNDLIAIDGAAANALGAQAGAIHCGLRAADLVLEEQHVASSGALEPRAKQAAGANAGLS